MAKAGEPAVLPCYPVTHAANGVKHLFFEFVEKLTRAAILL